ncbi:hypothetical protein WME94_20295 [Sorangium sp. So ce429]
MALGVTRHQLAAAMADRGDVITDTKAKRDYNAVLRDGARTASRTGRRLARRRSRGLPRTLPCWLFPQLGDKPITAVTRRDVDAFIEHLDNSARAGEQSWKTAVNTWRLVSKLFNGACDAKALSLRVLSSNPAAEVRGPDWGIKKAKAYLYPPECYRSCRARTSRLSGAAPWRS